MKPKFNDHVYCQTIEEWEDKTVPSRVNSVQITWGKQLLPAAVAVGALAQPRWQIWLCIMVVAYVFLFLFTFLEEINQNIRFVRHQTRALRDGVREAVDLFNKYREPERNVTVFDALASIDREWEDPRPKR